MAEITIRLVSDPQTGEKRITIDYESDRDALPIEHERDHREIVEALIGRGALRPGQNAQVAISRPEPACAACGADDSQAEAEVLEESR